MWGSGGLCLSLCARAGTGRLDFESRPAPLSKQEKRRNDLKTPLVKSVARLVQRTLDLLTVGFLRVGSCSSIALGEGNRRER